MVAQTKSSSLIRVILAYTITYLIGMLFVEQNSFISAIWPASGVIYVAYYFLRKDALPVVVSLVFVFTILMRISDGSYPLIESFVLALVDTIAVLLSLLLFTFLLDTLKANLKQLSKGVNGVKFIFATISATLLGALISNLGLSIFYGLDEYFISVFRWFVGDFLGVLIFGSLLIYSHYRDKSFLHHNNDIGLIIIFIALYSLVCNYIFVDMTKMYLIRNLQVFLFVAYVLTAFLFSYRMIIINNLIYLLFFGIVGLPNIQQDDLVNSFVLHSVYLVSLSSIATLIKNILHERDLNYLDLEHTRDNLERMILSANQLFDVEDQVPDQIQESRHDYLKSMFELACKIYPKFTKASLNLKEGKYVQFLATKNYDTQHLNNMKFLSSAFIWNLDEPSIVYGTDYEKSLEEDTKADEFIVRYGVLKESIRFTVKFNEDSVAGMSFDLFEHDVESFNEYDVENFRTFQSLMNSYSKLNILHSERNSLKDSLVLSLVRTLEFYDSYTGGHSEEVAELSFEIGKKLQLNEEELRHIFWSAIVHDIGKIGIDINVLNKKGRLTEAEYETVKKHATYGYQILSKTEGLEEVANTVRHHHEWWNGNGYPDGLKGMEIPYSAQIIHVCDAVSAMAKERVYKKALSEEEIVKELQRGLGKQFSPKVAKVMIKYIEDGSLKGFLQPQKNKAVF